MSFNNFGDLQRLREAEELAVMEALQLPQPEPATNRISIPIEFPGLDEAVEKVEKLLDLLTRCKALCDGLDAIPTDEDEVPGFEVNSIRPDRPDR